MEENIRLNIFIRVLGLCVCLTLIWAIIYIITGDSKAPLDVIIGFVILLISFGPFYVLGYIPGRFLDKLSSFLVNLIKLKPL